MKRIPKETLFVVDVYMNWAVDRVWQTKLLDISTKEVNWIN